MSAAPDVVRVARWARRLGAGEVLHLRCPTAGTPTGPGADQEAIAWSGCLADLGVADLAELVSAAPVLAVHPCDACGGVAAAPSLLRTLEALGCGHRLRLGHPSPRAGGARPTAVALPVSRRDILAWARGAVAVDRGGGVVPTTTVREAQGRVRHAIPDGLRHGEAADQVRLTAALREVVRQEETSPGAGDPATAAEPTRAHHLSSDGCTACSTCVRVCPTAALSLSPDAADGVALTLEPAACVGCGRCLALCPVGALADAGPEGQVALALSPSPRVLEHLTVRACERCRTTFAGDGIMCQVCTLRGSDPFGSWLPPGYVAPRVYAQPDHSG